MKPIKTECPFHHTILEIGGHCKQCDYKIEKTYKNNFRFTKSEEDKDIYKSYQNAYEQLSEDDLKNAIYAEQYQSDLAFETHKSMGPVGGLDVAELGVGRGFLQKSILSQKPKSLHALDIAEEYVRNASRIFSDCKDDSINFSTSVGNVEFMPFVQSFDLVVATDILEHVLNLGNALVRITRSLKVGGKFVCRVPYKEKLGQYSVYNNQRYEFAHLRFFDEKLLKLQFEEVGLKPTLVRRNGFQPGRFNQLVPIFFRKNLARAFSLFRLYGDNWYEFNRKSRSFPLKFFRLFHQPMELLIISKKV